MELFQVDFSDLLTPRVSPIEAFLRGTFMYFAVFTLLRIVPRRTLGSIGVMDLLVVVLVAEAAGQAMGVNSESLIDGLFVVATLVGWDYCLNWLTYRVPLIERLVEPPPLPVIRDGKLLRRNMRKELLTENELMRQLRLQGLEDVRGIKYAYIESDGSISIIKYDSEHEGNRAALDRRRARA